MVGNAAAALHGAPVTTLDIDFMFRKTPTNLRKLKDFADELDAQILKPFYPVSSRYRIVNDDTGIQVDFMSILQRKDRSKQLKALKKESERNLIEQIRRQLALPMNRRTNFLRKRLPGGGSCL
jgi:hypothetical protein